jgi:hypothetical protein
MIPMKKCSILLLLLLSALALLSCKKAITPPLILSSETVEFLSTSPALAENEKAVLIYPYTLSIPEEDRREAVNALMGPEGLFGESVYMLSNSFSTGGTPFDSATFQVLFNRNNILQIRWIYQVTGTSTEVVKKTVNIDVLTAKTFGPESMFEDDRAVVRFIQERMSPRIEEMKRKALETAGDQSEIIRGLLEGQEYSWEMLEETEISEKGLYFVFEPGFPVALRSLEPDPIREFVSWEELKPFMYKGSILHRIF